MARLLILLSLLSVVGAPTSPAASHSASKAPIDDFEQAKRALAKIYSGDHTEFYCGCPFRGKTVDIDRCGYRPKKDARRARRIEWEHVVPAQAFGQSFKEWREGHPACVDKRGRKFKGRKCAEKTSPEFNHMEADLYNLQPAIGELNGLRSNYSMAEIPGEPREFGACDAEIADHKFEPRAAIRGDIARIYLYMHQTYPGRGIISAKNQALFQAWDKLDPVDRDECARYAKVRAVLPSDNVILRDRCTGSLAVAQ